MKPMGFGCFANNREAGVVAAAAAMHAAVASSSHMRLGLVHGLVQLQ